MRASTAPVLAVAAVIAFVAGCGGDQVPDDVASGAGASRSKAGSAAGQAAEATKKTRCDVGGRPEYFVPKPEGSPIAVIGCARLGVSMKPVEFSANSDRIGRTDIICLNPAYEGGGRLGVYIPAHCPNDPLPRRLYVFRVEVPRQAVRGYRLVIWGTAAPSTRQVVAHYKGGETEAAVFVVRRRLAHAVGATRPFSLFVVELHRQAACHRVILRAADTSPLGTKRLEPRHRLCRSD